jgi:hypothetical protein
MANQVNIANPSKIYHINLDTDRCTEQTDDDLYIFELNDMISLSRSNAYITVNECQFLNTIYNMTDLNGRVNSRYVFPPGHYNYTDIISQFRTFDDIIDKVSLEFDTRTLKFKLKALLIDTDLSNIITGPFLIFLNMEIDDIDTDKVDGIQSLTSSRPVDFHSRSNNLHIVMENVTLQSNVSTNIQKKYMSNRLSKIQITSNFGFYNIHENTKGHRTLLNADSLNTFALRFVNDNDENILTDTRVTLTITITTYDKADDLSEETDDTIDKLARTDYAMYPIINQRTSYLKNAKQIMIDRRSLSKKYLRPDHPLNGFSKEELNDLMIARTAVLRDIKIRQYLLHNGNN